MGADPVDVLIVGAGAAGLWCAEVAARAGRSVRVLEKTPRTGTKVLASGGTRCNITTTLGPADAARLFGTKGERFLRHAFQNLPPAEVRARFEGWGVGTEEAPLEKIFPASGNAKDVRDALENAARGAGAEILLEQSVAAIGSSGDGWSIITGRGEEHSGRALVLAAGGKSYPLTGTVGEGYAWLADLGLEIVEPVPALVPLRSREEWVHSLTGLSWQGGEVWLEDTDGKALQRRRRPLLFTHQGLSGPGAMDVSHHVARGTAGDGARVRLDFFPDIHRDELRTMLVDAAGLPGSPRLQRALGSMPTGPMARRLFDAVAAVAGVPTDIPVGGIAKAQRHSIIETLKGLPVPVNGTLGWEHAEVTSGGLALKSLNPRTMAVNGHDGLFVIGELLDVDGPIGGLSFQAAWATAQLAGEALSA